MSDEKPAREFWIEELKNYPWVVWTKQDLTPKIKHKDFTRVIEYKAYKYEKDQHSKNMYEAGLKYGELMKERDQAILALTEAKKQRDEFHWQAKQLAGALEEIKTFQYPNSQPHKMQIIAQNRLVDWHQFLAQRKDVSWR